MHVVRVVTKPGRLDEVRVVEATGPERATATVDRWSVSASADACPGVVMASVQFERYVGLAPSGAGLAEHVRDHLKMRTVLDRTGGRFPEGRGLHAGLRLAVCPPSGSIRRVALSIVSCCTSTAAATWPVRSTRTATSTGHLAVAMGCRVLALDYRLAPEHPHPAPVTDDGRRLSVAARRGHRLPEHVVIAGDSAGGGLTMATLLKARGRRRGDAGRRGADLADVGPRGDGRIDDVVLLDAPPFDLPRDGVGDRRVVPRRRRPPSIRTQHRCTATSPDSRRC